MSIEYTINDVFTVAGKNINPNWNQAMQVIITDGGSFIDNLPPPQSNGYDWEKEIGNTVKVEVNYDKYFNQWLSPAVKTETKFLFIQSFEIVKGNAINPTWKKPMYRIETDQGFFIDRLETDGGFDWDNNIGRTIECKISIDKDISLPWIRPVREKMPIGLLKNNGEGTLPPDYNITSNAGLKQTYDYIRDNEPVIFLTGGAGTGKSTFIKFLKQNLKSDMNKECIVLAPTGIAAINAGGETIHKFFNFPFDPFTNEKVIPKIHKNPIIDHVDLIIIDEISMVRSCMLDHIDFALRKWCKNEKPFGGKQLLLVGDCFQLPPIKEENSRKTEKELESLKKFYSQWDNAFFFAAKSLNSIDLKCVQLEEIYRQKDKAFAHMLNRIRVRNEGFEKDIAFLNRNCILQSRFKKNELPNECLLLVTTNNQAKTFNENKITLMELNGEPSETFKASYSGDWSETEAKDFLTPHTLKICKGAKVMVTKNIRDLNLVNGDIGRVIDCFCGIDENDQYVDVEIKKNKYRIKRETWQKVSYKWDEQNKIVTQIPTGEFRQIPLKLAWAVTIHKSQGLTLDAVAIDATNAWEPGQVYVALSRARTLNGLFLYREISPNSVKTDDYILEKYQQLFPKLSGENLYNAEEYKNISFDDSIFTFGKYLDRRKIEIGEIEVELYPSSGIKIQAHVKRTLQILLKNNLIPYEEMNKLLTDKNYCYNTLGIKAFENKFNKEQYVLLSKHKATFYNEKHHQYKCWKDKIEGYYVCSQWYSDCEPLFARWLIKLASQNKMK